MVENEMQERVLGALREENISMFFIIKANEKKKIKSDDSFIVFVYLVSWFPWQLPWDMIEMTNNIDTTKPVVPKTVWSATGSLEGKQSCY